MCRCIFATKLSDVGRVAVHILFVVFFTFVSRANSANLTSRRDVLQQLLSSKHYDPRILPYYEEGRATDVTVQVYILSVYSFNEISMEYSMDIFLRQTWHDPRLTFSHLSNIASLEVDKKVTERVWIPDIYFPNERQSSIHSDRFTSKLLHILNNGTVFYSVRLALTLSCRMEFYSFPLDVQICPLLIESYGYTIDNVVFHWLEGSAVIIQDQEIPFFHIKQYSKPVTCSRDYKLYSNTNFSCLLTKFRFQRNIGIYITQVFLPCILIVCLSWISFWIHEDAVPARVSLGVMTILTLITQMAGLESAIPRISNVKAIDIWNSTCLIFVFASILEYAYINAQSRQAFKSDKDKASEGTNGKINEDVIVTPKRIHTTDHLTQAHGVDRVSRVLFPVSFTVFNLIFWLYYLVIINEKDFHE